MHIGYALNVDHYILEQIDTNYTKVEEKSFRMVVEWIKRDENPCYCKLISSMKEQGLSDATQILEQIIKSSKILLLIVQYVTSFAKVGLLHTTVSIYQSIICQLSI